MRRKLLAGAVLGLLFLLGVYFGYASLLRHALNNYARQTGSLIPNLQTTAPASQRGSEPATNSPVSSGSAGAAATVTSGDGDKQTQKRADTGGANDPDRDSAQAATPSHTGYESSASGTKLTATPSETTTLGETTKPKETMVWPVSGTLAASPGWYFSQDLREWRYLPGILIRAEGQDVRAALSGKVAAVSRDPVLGTVIVINHDGALETSYSGNLSPSVKPGDAVTRGDIIARLDGGVLFFKVAENGEAVDPREHLKGGS